MSLEIMTHLPKALMSPYRRANSGLDWPVIVMSALCSFPRFMIYYFGANQKYTNTNSVRRFEVLVVFENCKGFYEGLKVFTIREETLQTLLGEFVLNTENFNSNSSNYITAIGQTRTTLIPIYVTRTT